ncbi:MAG TPA: DinB family protein [Gemmatimonadaceae bacterium]|jgi:uncharacterized damage-inducible protein DinB
MATVAPEVLNPYLKFLDAIDPIDSMRESPVAIAQMIADAADEDLERSLGPGKWSVREILCHLADCELSFGVRLRQGVAEAHHMIQIFDPDLWAKQYEGIPAREAMDAYAATRSWNLRFLENVLPDALERPITHPRRGTMTYRHVLETVAGHDRNHLLQIERILSA